MAISESDWISYVGLNSSSDSGQFESIVREGSPTKLATLVLRVILSERYLTPEVMSRFDLPEADFPEHISLNWYLEIQLGVRKGIQCVLKSAAPEQLNALGKLIEDILLDRGESAFTEEDSFEIYEDTVRSRTHARHLFNWGFSFDGFFERPLLEFGHRRIVRPDLDYEYSNLEVAFGEKSLLKCLTLSVRERNEKLLRQILSQPLRLPKTEADLSSLNIRAIDWLLRCVESDETIRWRRACCDALLEVARRRPADQEFSKCVHRWCQAAKYYPE